VPLRPAEGLLRRYVAEIETEMARLAALRAELLGMLAATPGPGCPEAPGRGPSSRAVSHRTR
jgi:hypothetical protein